MESYEIGFHSLPHDLLQDYIIAKYFIYNIQDSDIDTTPLPATILMLQTVNKTFFNATKNGTLSKKVLENFRSHSEATSRGASPSRLMMRRACKDGHLAVIKYLIETLKYPVDHHCFAGAAEGTSKKKVISMHHLNFDPAFRWTYSPAGVARGKSSWRELAIILRRELRTAHLSDQMGNKAWG